MGCRRAAPQHELVRITHGPERLVVSRTAPGRGAWLCAESTRCLDQAERRKAFTRALRTPVTGGEIAALRATLAW